MYYYKWLVTNMQTGEECYTYCSSKQRELNDYLIEISKEEFERGDFLLRYPSKINSLKNELQKTDYIALKIAEGVATKEDYSFEIIQRQNLREQINKLEEQAQQYLKEENNK